MYDRSGRVGQAAANTNISKPGWAQRMGSFGKRFSGWWQPNGVRERLVRFLSFRVRVIPVVIFLTTLLCTVRIIKVVDKIRHESVVSLQSSNATPTQNAPAAAQNTARGKEQTIKMPDKFDPLNLSPEQYQALRNLMHAQDKLRKEEALLPEKEQILRTLIKRLEEKRAELSQTKKELQALIDKIEKNENANTMRLVKMAEAMKPIEAARLLQGVEFDILLEIMEKMSARRASAVVAAMPPEKGSYLMTSLAKRRKIITDDRQRAAAQ